MSYHETAEANRELPDVRGALHECADCGVAFPSHLYLAEAFPKLYGKALTDLEFFDRSSMQTLRKICLRAILSGRHRRLSMARLLDLMSLRVFQVPRLGRSPRGLRLLDVGCGFGEFLSIYRGLGSDVVGTEIVPELVERLRGRGFDCRLGELESLRIEPGFDVVLLRAVFYRTRDPRATLRAIKGLLGKHGEVVLIDPCPGREGAPYFFRKQFPQGQFYILDPERYLAVLHREGFDCADRRLIYGRPNTPLRPVRRLGNVLGLGELLLANLLHWKPYVLSYRLVAMC